MNAMFDPAVMPGSAPAARAEGGRPGPAPRAGATTVSVVLHAGLIGALWLVAIHAPRPVPPPESMRVVFEAPATPATTQELSAATLSPQSSMATDPLTATLPGVAVTARVPAAAPPMVVPRPAGTAAGALAPAGAAPAGSAPATRAPAAIPTPAASPGDIAGLKLRIREAVRSATLYPAVARQMHREGRTQVSFDYVDGAAQDVSLAHSSQSKLLDDAALSAVRRAAYPKPLPGMAGMRLSLMVWVNFGLEEE